MSKKIQRLQFFEPVSIGKTSRSHLLVEHREWHGWAVDALPQGGKVTITAPDGTIYEIPRTNCVITWGADAA